MSINMSNTFKINSDDKVFIDANILIFLFSPDFVHSKKSQIDRYSSIFEKSIEEKCEIYINSHVISEFINTCLRIDFKKHFKDEKDLKDFKKDYRNTKRHDETLNLIMAKLKDFSKLNVIQLDDKFSDFDIQDNYKNNKESDFNDLIIAYNVNKYNLKLLSDDKDFNNNHNIDIYWYL